MNLLEAKEIFGVGWPDSQFMQREFDAGKWLIAEVEQQAAALAEGIPVLKAAARRIEELEDSLLYVNLKPCPQCVMAELEIERLQKDSDINSPWLALAHTICTDAGIPPGDIMGRLEALNKLMEEVGMYDEGGE